MTPTKIEELIKKRTTDWEEHPPKIVPPLEPSKPEGQ